jgi:GT2 family glycosyltransferase
MIKKIREEMLKNIKKIFHIIRYVKNNPKVIKKAYIIFINEGLKGLFQRIFRKNVNYKYKQPILNKLIKKEIENFNKRPLISIIMPVYNIDPKWLDKAIKSIEEQWYMNWELCIADDKSTNSKTIEYLKSIKNSKIKIKFLDKNLNISGASNAALELATGEYISLMDNDDEITPDALYEIVKVINETSADFIYSDEDFMTINNECVNPHFKPDFSPDLLLSHNYITHFTTFRKSLLEKVGSFNSEFDGAQDYDLFLRLTEVCKKIYHIPKVLYHWRMLETSTSSNSEVKPEALNRGKELLEKTLKRRNIVGVVENANLNHYFKIKYEILDNPLVSIVIPFKDKPELLKMCIESILDRTIYENFEIIGISNNSSENETFHEMKRLEELDKRVRFYEYNVSFNYSQINNYAVKTYVNGKHIILLNNDIEIISSNWIEEMLMHSQKDDVGCVGAKLYYPDGKIQHAGIIMGLGGYAAHSHRLFNRNDYGYFNRLNIVQNLSGVTGACLMIKKDTYLKLNGLDEVNFVIAYNDVDFCLRVLKAGYKNIFTPFAEAYHYESLSRGDDTKDNEKNKRFDIEKGNLLKIHGSFIEEGDPYYNKNLTLSNENFSLK